MKAEREKPEGVGDIYWTHQVENGQRSCVIYYFKLDELTRAGLGLFYKELMEKPSHAYALGWEIIQEFNSPRYNDGQFTGGMSISIGKPMGILSIRSRELMTNEEGDRIVGMRLNGTYASGYGSVDDWKKDLGAQIGDAGRGRLALLIGQRTPSSVPKCLSSERCSTSFKEIFKRRTRTKGKLFPTPNFRC